VEERRLQMPRFSAYFFILLFLLGFALNANAALVSVTGPNSSAGAASAIIPPPTDVLDDIVTNTGMQGFNEVLNVTTTVAHQIDGGSIAAKTRVDSHMIFLNSDGDTAIAHYNVVWKFATPIIGVMSDKGGTFEANSTFELGNPLTNYTVTTPTSGPAAPFNARGLEGVGDPTMMDGYSIGGINNDELTVGMLVTEPGDWIRVVTNAVPIPSSILLLGSALICLAGIRRKSKK
jgi:hypothetical protein